MKIDLFDEDLMPSKEDESSLLLFAETGDPKAQYLLGKYLVSSQLKQYEEGFHWLQKSANQGYVKGINALGVCYDYGYGVEPNEHKAFELYKQAAEQGLPKAQKNLGYDYQHGIGSTVDEAKAVYWYLQAANQGHPEAQLLLGDCFWNGIGVERDKNQAYKWYQSAANNGEPRAQYYIGLFYQRGDYLDCVPIDSEKAFIWVKKAAEQEYISAQCLLGAFFWNGFGTERNEEKSLEWYLKAAQEGDAVAQENAGLIYIRRQGKTNKKKAFEWFSKAAERGDAEAQQNLGSCYLYGDGVEKNERLAFEWYSKSAEQGFAVAQRYVADCFYIGSGTNQDYGKAFQYYCLAADKGDSYAYCSLGFCYKNGIGIDTNYDLAFSNYSIAANIGNLDGKYEVGRCYWEGIGTAKDRNKAFKIWQELADSGHSNAQASIACCFLSGDCVEQNNDRAFHYYNESANNGNEFGLYGLGFCFENGYGTTPDKKKAFQCFEESASKDYAQAQFVSGLYYLYGDSSIGLESDWNKAFKYFSDSSEAGFSAAMSLLSICYCDGLGVEKDEKKAIELASNFQNDESAYSNYALGYIYYRCNTLKDYNLSRQYLEKAKEAIPNAYNLLSIIYLKQKKYALSFENAEKSAQEENPIGLLLLAHFYDNGYGVRENSAIAKMYISKAIGHNLKKEIDLQMFDIIVKSDAKLSLTDSLIAKMQLDKGISFSRAINKVLGSYPLMVQVSFNRTHGMPEYNEVWIGNETLSEYTYNRLNSWNYEINPDFEKYHMKQQGLFRSNTDMFFSNVEFKDMKKVIDYVEQKYSSINKLKDDSFRKELVEFFFPDKGSDAIESLQLKIKEYMIIQNSVILSTSKMKQDEEDRELEIEDPNGKAPDYAFSHEEDLNRLKEFIQGFDNKISNTVSKDVSTIYMARMLFYVPRRSDNYLSQLSGEEDNHEKTRIMVGRYLYENMRDVSVDELKKILAGTKHFCADIQWYFDERTKRQKTIKPIDDSEKWQHDDLTNKEICMFLGKQESRFTNTCKNLDEKLKDYLSELSLTKEQLND